MKRQPIVKTLSLATAAALTSAVNAHAGEIGHYNRGILNIRDYLMSDPGFYGVIYVGYGFWTQQIQGAVAWCPTAVVLPLTYEINGNKEDFDLTPRRNITLNWGISQFLPPKKDGSLMLELGSAGYDTWQITSDSGSNADPVRDQVQAWRSFLWPA